VWFSDLNLAAAEQAAQESAARGHAVAGAVALDVGKLASIAAMAQAVAALPPLVLVNNAGLQHVSRLEVGPPAAAEGPRRETMDIH
jgi:3-hydroxybutyrate dehydrogenase